MSEQATLFDKPKGKRLTIEELFYAWAKENPHVIDSCLSFARELKSAGRKHYGMKAIFERVRWHLNIETKGDEFKLNNNYTAPMARLLVKIDPKLDGLFQFRERRKR